VLAVEAAGELDRAASARPARSASRTASALSTGRLPGAPEHTGHTCVLGLAPNSEAQPQKSFELVPSWQCTSSPITVRHSEACAGWTLTESWPWEAVGGGGG